MPEQRRIGYKWNLRTVMAQRNLWKSTELMPLECASLKWTHLERF